MTASVDDVSGARRCRRGAEGDVFDSATVKSECMYPGGHRRQQ